MTVSEQGCRVKRAPSVRRVTGKPCPCPARRGNLHADAQPYPPRSSLMNVRYLIVAATLVLFPVAGHADEWKTYSSKEGGFSVVMPGKPQEQTQEVKTPDGKLALHLLVSA